MLSDDKINHMSHVILKALLDKDIIDILEEEGKVRHAIRRAIIQQMQLGQSMDEAVRKKIASLSRHVVEGSQEWEVLYQQYMDQEQVRQGIRD